MYSIFSPAFTVLLAVLLIVISGVLNVVSVVFVSSSFTVAVLDIISPSVKSPTVTANDTVAFPFAGTVTVIPFPFSSLILCVVVPFLSLTVTSPLFAIVTFVGTLSFTTAVPSALPSFVTVIVYVIVSPFCAVSASFPFISAFFSADIIGS